MGEKTANLSITTSGKYVNGYDESLVEPTNIAMIYEGELVGLITFIPHEMGDYVEVQEGNLEVEYEEEDGMEHIYVNSQDVPDGVQVDAYLSGRSVNID